MRKRIAHFKTAAKSRVAILKSTETTARLIPVVRAIHHLVVAFVLLGWLAPTLNLLIVYIGFVPLMYLHWATNQGVCFLTSLENFLKTGVWQMSEYQAQAGFTASLLKMILGREPSLRASLSVAYSIPAVGWVLGMVRLIEMTH